MVLEQPVDAVRFATLFIGSKRQNDVAIGRVTLLLEVDQRGDHDGVAALHVLRAAAVVEPVLLYKPERICSPVFGVGLDNIKMTNQQDGFVFSHPVQPHHQILLAVLGTRARKRRRATKERRTEQTLCHGSIGPPGTTESKSLYPRKLNTFYPKGLHWANDGACGNYSGPDVPSWEASGNFHAETLLGNFRA